MQGATCTVCSKQLKMNIQRLLITIGIVLLILGLVWPLLQKLGLGRLPGDIAIERDNFRFYFPIVTSIVISLVLTLLFWLFRK
ncbi:MAG: hypothetical protein FD165_1378 [Gammaproteobacteria bacterium]|nr:MAG: hypothetical protein FD165_1378 [Gammaproteobacteria bacterium]TND04033.1 MAG: hypothetical protein FD120_1742 [Gammaproteobacteria bacterium]